MTLDKTAKVKVIMIEFLKYLKFELEKQNAFSNKSEGASTEDDKKKF